MDRANLLRTARKSDDWRRHALASVVRRVVPERIRPIGYITDLARKRTGSRVRTGPFAGLNYVAWSVGSAYIPKLLGIYEREVAPQIEKACKARPTLVVDIGAAEGYYAVGLAIRNPHARVIAFEMDEKGQAALREMARLNGVAERVEIRGRCGLHDLAEALGDEPRSMVVCDVEGEEQSLLDPDAVPALRSATIIVELHDFLVPRITETIKLRFAETHVISHVWQESRSAQEFPWRTLGTALLPKSYLHWAVSEWRPVQMSWLCMEPKRND